MCSPATTISANSWWPYGDGDLLERAMIIGYRSGFNTDADNWRPPSTW